MSSINGHDKKAISTTPRFTLATNSSERGRKNKGTPRPCRRQGRFFGTARRTLHLWANCCQNNLAPVEADTGNTNTNEQPLFSPFFHILTLAQLYLIFQ